MKVNALVIYSKCIVCTIILCQGCASAGNDSGSRAARPLTGSRRQKAMDHQTEEIRSAAPAGVAAASAAPAGAAVAPVGRPCPLQPCRHLLPLSRHMIRCRMFKPFLMRKIECLLAPLVNLLIPMKDHFSRHLFPTKKKNVIFQTKTDHSTVTAKKCHKWFKFVSFDLIQFICSCLIKLINVQYDKMYMQI